MADNNLDLGAWEADRPAIEHAPTVDRGDVADLDPHHQFPIHVARTICKSERCRRVDVSSQPAGFVLVDHRLQAGLKESGERQMDSTFSTGVKPLVGRIHFVTEAVTRSVYETFDGSDDQLIFDRLYALALHELPTLIYLPRPSGSVLVFLPHGSGSDAGTHEIRLKVTAISEEDIVEAIQSVYDAELKTPDLARPFPIWHEARKGCPIEEAELGIQKFVRIGLATKFHWCRVAMEQPDKEGRTDLELMDEASGIAGEVVRHAILELKVLRSRGSSGNPYSEADVAAHVADGVNQVFAYGARRSCVHRLLCCFDMRDSDLGDDVTFAHVKAQATQLAVKLYRWFLYRTSEDYRAAMVQSAIALTAPTNPA